MNLFLSADPVMTNFQPSMEMQSNGFILAIVIMIGMAITLLYSIVAFIAGKSVGLPGWAEWLVPGLILLGIAVAGYLSYVEWADCRLKYCPAKSLCQVVRYSACWGPWPYGIHCSAYSLAGNEIHAPT